MIPSRFLLQPSTPSPTSSQESLLSQSSGTCNKPATPSVDDTIKKWEDFEPVASLLNFVARGLNTKSHYEVKNTVDFAREATQLWEKSQQSPKDFIILLTRYNRIIGEFVRIKNKASWATAVSAGVRDNDMRRIANATDNFGAVVIQAAQSYLSQLEADEGRAFDTWEESDMQDAAFEMFTCYLGAVIAQRDALDKAVHQSPLRFHSGFAALSDTLLERHQSILNCLGSAVLTMSQSIATFVSDRIDDAALVVATQPEAAERATQYAHQLHAEALATGVLLDRDQQQIVRALDDLRQTAGVPPEETCA